MYDPTTGRWLSVDLLFPEADTNPYRYAGNDPTNATDPSGLQPSLFDIDSGWKSFAAIKEERFNSELIVPLERGRAFRKIEVAEARIQKNLQIEALHTDLAKYIGFAEYKWTKKEQATRYLMRNIMQAGIGLDRDFVKGVVADTIDNMWKEYSMTVYHDLDYIYQTHLRDALLNSQGLRDENPDLVKGSKAYQEKKEYEEVGKQFQKELENENGLLRQFERGSEKARFSFMLNVWKKAF